MFSNSVGVVSLVLITTLGSFTYGFNSSIMGTVFGLKSFYSYFDLDTTGPGADYAASIIGGKLARGLLSTGYTDTPL